VGYFLKRLTLRKLKNGMANIWAWMIQSFKWIDPNEQGSKVPALTAWSPFKDDTTYFNPSEKQFMFNYRVENLVELLKVLKGGRSSDCWRNGRVPIR
jgi:hypothetical protein